MQANDFEKDVQHKMEELQLYPTAEVWTAVEKKIRYEKRRRRIIFWWWLPVLLLGTGGVIYFSNHKQKNAAIQHSTQNTITASKTEKPNDSPAANTGKSSEAETGEKAGNTKTSPVQQEENRLVTGKNDQLSKNVSRMENNPVEKQVRSSSIKEEESRKVSIVSQSAVKLHRQKKNETPAPENKSLASGKKVEQPPAIKTVESPKDETAVKPGSDQPAMLTQAVVPVETKKDGYPDSSSINVKNTKPEKNDSAKAVVSIPVKLKKQHSKWEIDILAMTGISTRTGGIAIASEKANVSSPATTGANLSTGIGVFQRNTPGELFSDFSWKAGIEVRRNLSNRSAITFGMQLSSYSAQQLAGSLVQDSLMLSLIPVNNNAARYYQNGESVTLHTRYNYIELPVSFNWQTNKSQRLPITWQNGFAPSFYAGGNSISFHPDQNIYYKDKSAINQFQLVVHTGLFTRFGMNSKHPFRAGVLFNYQLNGLLKSDAENKNHFSSFGLQVGWTIKK